jgi:hypothetical protein
MDDRRDIPGAGQDEPVRLHGTAGSGEAGRVIEVFDTSVMEL